jgi:hypothetical protein
MISQVTVTTSPAHRGEHEGNRKTIAQGTLGRFGVPVVKILMCFFHSHMGPWVRLIHPAFPAPSLRKRSRLSRP